MAGSFRNRKYFLAFSGAFKRQSAFGVALSNADINTRHPQTTPTVPGKTITRDQIKDCTGEYVIREDITSRLVRLRFGFDCDPFLAAGWLALAQGAAAAPSGTRANEVHTVTPSGTIGGGTWNYEFTLEGVVDDVDIPWNATAPQIQALLEEVKSVGRGNVAVTGTLATTVVIAYQGKLAAFNLPAAVVDGTNLTGTTPGIALTTTTPGTSKIHNITRTTNDQTPLTSLIGGFEGDSTNPDKYSDVVVNSVTIRGEIKGKVSLELEIFASADVAQALSYSIPACVNINPVYTKDCRISFNSTFSSGVREFTYTFSNNIFTNDDPFPYDGIDAVRLEHGDRTSSFNFTVYGSKGDAVYTTAEDETAVPVQLILGSPSNRTVVDMPKLGPKLADDPITFAGEANRSAIQILGTPLYDSGTAGTPDRVFYYGAETATFLAT